MRNRALICLVFICLIILVAPSFAFGSTDVTVADEAELKAAIDGALADGTKQNIVIQDNIALQNEMTVEAGKNICLQVASGKTITISRNAGATYNYFFTIKKGATLEVDGDFTFDATHPSGTAAFFDCEGSLIINKGVFKNSTVRTSNAGAIRAYGQDAKVTFNDGTLTGSSVRSGHSGGIFIKDKATLNMTGGSVENSQIDNQFCGAVVIDNANMTLSGGKIQKNQNKNQIQSAGGLLIIALKDNASASNNCNSMVTMNGGEIINNSSVCGGGVYVYGGNAQYADLYSEATFTMKKGVISGNSASSIKISGGRQIVAGGGGVYVESNGKFNMNGGTISGNVSEGQGGGVATYDTFVEHYGRNPYSSVSGLTYMGRNLEEWDKFYAASFVMNGGTVSDNRATGGDYSDKGCGGGIYCASNNVELNAGTIKNNLASRQGGGAYVGSVPYILKMNDSLVNGNSASIIGGGIWCCPTGTLDVFVNSGSAIYDNKADNAADEIAIVRTNTRFKTTVADRMLGGGPSRWYEDGEIDQSSLGNAEPNSKRYDANNPNANVAVFGIKESTKSLALKAVPEETSKELAGAKAKLIVSGNTSQRGGGIGSNGGLEIGNKNIYEKNVSVQKKWMLSDGSIITEANNKTPGKVIVWLIIEDKKIESKELSKENKWTAEFKNLPVDAILNVEEEQLSGWIPAYSKEEEKNGDVEFTITNKASKTEPAKESTKAYNSPSSGDDSFIGICIALMLLAAIVGGIIAISHKIRKNNAK